MYKSFYNYARTLETNWKNENFNDIEDIKDYYSMLDKLIKDLFAIEENLQTQNNGKIKNLKIIKPKDKFSFKYMYLFIFIY